MPPNTILAAEFICVKSVGVKLYSAASAGPMALRYVVLAAFKSTRRAVMLAAAVFIAAAWGARSWITCAGVVEVELVKPRRETEVTKI